MTPSFYDVSVRTYQQIVGATAGFLAKGAEHFAAAGTDLAEVARSRLRDDMATLQFQVFCVAHHSIGALDGMRSGVFLPPADDRGLKGSDLEYADLQALIAETADKLAALEEDAVNALAAGKLVFRIGGNELPFTNPDFLLTFSLPNFYFHATTAYDILRAKGVPIGKRDFLGQMRIG
jgi:hypothetical protein